MAMPRCWSWTAAPACGSIAALTRAPVTFGVRPEHVRVDEDAELALKIQVGDRGLLGVEHLGERSYSYWALPFGELTVAGDSSHNNTGVLPLTFDLDHLHYFDDRGRAIGPDAGA